jgi:transposase
VQNIVSRNCGFKLSSNDIKRVTEDRVSPLLSDPIELSLAGSVSKEVIDCLGSQIRRVENCVERGARCQPPYPHLLTIPGVGKILGLTILLETGPIGRFEDVGNYASYCRKVPSRWTTNGKTKGKGNTKNGNKYLAWAFSEAAELSKRYDDAARSYYTRKQRKTNRMIAHSALANKLARAAFYIMRDQVAFKPEKLFG